MSVKIKLHIFFLFIKRLILGQKVNEDKFEIKFKVILECKRSGDVSGNCCCSTKIYGNSSEDMQSHEKVIN